MHQICEGFYCILYYEEMVEVGPKTDFLSHFERFFVYTHLRPISYAPIFFQIKRAMELHNRGKFHQCSICGYQVINFQIFL